MSNRWKRLRKNKTPKILLESTPPLKKKDNPFFEQTDEGKELSRIKRSLGSVIDTLYDEHPSILSRSSVVWGRFSSWKKIILGLFVFGTLIVSGVLAEIVALIVVGAVSAVLSLGVSLLLDNHYKASLHSKENLKSAVYGLADVLEQTIEALNSTCAQLVSLVDALTVQVAQFTAENEKLGGHVSSLLGVNTQLSLRLQEFTTVQEALSKTKDQLVERERVYGELNTSFSDLIKAYSLSQNELQAEVKEKIGRLEALCKGKDKTIADLNEICVSAGGFTTKIDDFIVKNTEVWQSSLDKLEQERLQQSAAAKAQMQILRTEWDTSIASYKALLTEHALLLKRWDEQMSGNFQPIGLASVPFQGHIKKGPTFFSDSTRMSSVSDNDCTLEFGLN